jgi:flagellar protein FliS
MSYPPNAFSAIDEYARLGLRTDIETASPHRLILLLLDGALEKLRAARGAMTRGNIAAKGSNITWAMSIIDGLRASLNLERGGQIAANLDALYDYMTRTLVTANLHNDEDKLVEVEKLLGEIRVGWKGIETVVESGVPATVQNELGATARVYG